MKDVITNPINILLRKKRKRVAFVLLAPLFIALCGIANLNTAHASFSRQEKQTELQTRDNKVPASFSMTEKSFSEDWDRAEHDQPINPLASLIDLNSVKALNLQAAQIWDLLRSCQEDPKNANVLTAVRYLTGELCAPQLKSTAQIAQEKIKTLQTSIESFSASTWIGGNATQTRNQYHLPAAHPLFAQLLLERISLRMNEFSVGVQVSTDIKTIDQPRSSDKIEDSHQSAAQTFLNLILLLGYTPNNLGPQRAGLFSCPSRAVTSLLVENTLGTQDPTLETGWKKALLELENATKQGCPLLNPNKKGTAEESDKNIRWKYLQEFKVFASRYDVNTKGNVNTHIGTDLSWCPLFYGIHWRGKSTNLLWISIFPLTATAGTLDRILGGDQRISIWMVDREGG